MSRLVSASDTEQEQSTKRREPALDVGLSGGVLCCCLGELTEHAVKRWPSWLQQDKSAADERPLLRTVAAHSTWKEKNADPARASAKRSIACACLRSICSATGGRRPDRTNVSVDRKARACSSLVYLNA